MESVPVQHTALLYAEDRFESSKVLESKREAHDVLIADRYVASNLAHQGARCPAFRRDPFIDWLSRVEHDVNGMPRADLTVYLDVPVEISASLVSQRREREDKAPSVDMHESNLPYLSTCREVYQSLLDRQYQSRWVHINCVNAEGELRSIQSIGDEVLAAALEAVKGEE